MSTAVPNTRTANGGSTPRVTTAPTTARTTARTTQRATRTSTSRRGTKTVHVCYDQNMQQIKCPKRSIPGGKLGGIISGVVIGVVLLVVLLLLLYRWRKAKKARGVGGGETPPEPEKVSCGPSKEERCCRSGGARIDTSTPTPPWPTPTRRTSTTPPP